MALLLIAAVVSVCVLVKFPNYAPWYAELKKPWFVPPNSVFAVVWIAVYLLMAFALGRLLSMSPQTRGRRTAILLFLGQLGLNMLWTFLFFGLHSPPLGFAAIIAQLMCVAATIAAFRPLDREAALALAPLAAWLAFVALANYEVARLN